MFRNFTKLSEGSISMSVILLTFLSIMTVNRASAQLACNDQINVSLSENCEATITPAMVLEGEDDLPGGFDPADFEVTIEDHTGNVVLRPGIFTVTVTNVVNPPFISCWGHLLVEDKIAPEIDCDCPVGNSDPACSVNVACDQLDELLESGDLNLPVPAITDACSNFVDTLYRDNVTRGDMCSSTTIRRTWIFVDAAGTQWESCVMEYRLDPLDLTTTIKQPSSQVALSCGTGFSMPEIAEYKENLFYEAYIGSAVTAQDSADVREDARMYGLMQAYPTANGVPLFNTVCNTATTKEDIIIPLCGGVAGCDGNNKVIRKWTIYDWCNPGDEISFTQTIEVRDNEGPTFDVSSIEVSVDPWGCNASFYMPEPENLEDNCSKTVVWDVTGSGSTDVFVTFNPAKGYKVEAPKGTHTLYYRAYDCCDNETVQSVEVTVEDNTKPVAITKQDIVISLIPNPSDPSLNGITKLFAGSINNGSHDGCGQVHVEIRRDSDEFGQRLGNVTYNDDGHSFDDELDSDDGRYVTFDCSDIAEGGVDADGDGVNDYAMIKVWMRVWDDGDVDGVFGSAGDNFSEVWSHVRVEDKSLPTILCPVDIEINCDEDEFDLSIVGSASSTGACSGGAVDYEDIERDMSGCNVGVITRKWFVKGFSNISCEQEITKAGDGITIDDPMVVWPEDKTLDCTEVIGDDAPTWQQAQCDMFAWSVDVDTFFTTNEACLKLFKHYTLINWCIYDPNDVDSEGVWSHTQVVKIIDEQAPILTACDDVEFGADDYIDIDNDGNTCESHSVVLTNVAEDMGGCASDLRWFVTVDLYGDNTNDLIFSSSLPSSDPYYIAPTQSGEAVSIQVPEGVQGSVLSHRVLWRVTDQCGNSTSCTSYFNILDNVPPTPYCVNLSTALMEDGQVELWACDFDLGAFDNCSANNALRFTFSDVAPEDDPSYDPTTRCSGRLFTCDDIDLVAGGAQVTLNVYVWDEAGNSNNCQVNLTIRDNQNSCDTNGGSFADIGGVISTELGNPVQGVEVMLSSDNIQFNNSMKTDDQGAYRFETNPMHSDYIIEGEKNENYLNGVTTLDLVLIQRHILGLQSLDSPYKLLAADANGDGNVTSSDIVELRKLILGIYQELPSNDSWNFVANTSFTNPEKPSLEVETQRSILGLDNHRLQENFVGLKVGDVNNSVQSSENTTGRIVIDIDGQEGFEIGELIEVSLNSEESTALSGFQFTMDHSGLELVSIASDVIDISENNVATFGDKMTVSWANQNETNVVGSMVTMTFRAINEGSLSEAISINSDITQSQAYVGKDLQVVDIVLNNATQGFSLTQNTPNPFKVSTSITASVDSDEQGVFTVTDMTGKVVLNNTIALNKGLNTIEIEKDQLSQSGVYYYSLTVGESKLTKKLVLIE